MTEKSTERLVAEIPSELKALVDADPRTNKEVVEAALWREFGGERKGSLERRIEETRNRISMIETERDNRLRELEEERTKLEALESKFETIEEENDSELKRAKKELSEIYNPTEDTPKVQEWADRLDMEPADLLEELDR